jgi:hypothetical protein
LYYFISRCRVKRSIGYSIHFFLFFAPTETSQAAGRAFVERLGARKGDRDPPSDEQVMRAQFVAYQAWGTPQGERYARLRLFSSWTATMTR